MSIENVAQLQRMIHRAGYAEVRKQSGSHHHYVHERTGARLTVAFRKGQRIRPGTLKQIEQQVRAGAVSSLVEHVSAGVALQHARLMAPYASYALQQPATRRHHSAA